MRRAIPGAAALILLGAATAGAQDLDRGRALAERWCATCHVVGPEHPGGDAGPTFEAVANRDGQTLGGILAWLFEPHPPMPDMLLSPFEYGDLAAYIMSLREE